MGSLRHSPLKPLIGSEIHADPDLLLSGALAGELRALLLDRGILLFRDLEITLDQQRDITASIGTVLPGTAGDGLNKISADKTEAPELAGYLDTTFFWHLDGHIAQTTPCLGGSFRPVRLAPKGGQTEFLNAYAAYAGLDEDTRQLIDGLRAVHSVAAAGLTSEPQADDDAVARWRSVPTAVQPLVWEHGDGRKSLMLGAAIAYLEGLHPADSYDLLSRLRAHAERDDYVYSHKWRMNDLILWNNTGTLHRARPYAADSGRLLHRFTLAGEEPIVPPSLRE
jgi:alpha-ketoglutarate-dependent taurine dioxygenase